MHTACLSNFSLSQKIFRIKLLFTLNYPWRHQHPRCWRWWWRSTSSKKKIMFDKPASLDVLTLKGFNQIHSMYIYKKICKDFGRSGDKLPATWCPRWCSLDSRRSSIDNHARYPIHRGGRVLYGEQSESANLPCASLYCTM